MAMSYIWSGLVILSFLWGFFHGNLSAVAAAALDGAQSALELSLSMAGILCLWSPPPWPPSGLPSAVPPPSTFCPPSGSVLSPLSRWACSPPAFSPAGKEALHEPL